MKEDHSDSPFIEEIGGKPMSTPTALESEQPVPLETPEPIEPAQPEDKSIRLEAEIKYLRDWTEETEAALAGFKRRTRGFMLVAFLLLGVCGFVMVQMTNRNAKQVTDLKTVSDQIASLQAAASLPVKQSPVPDRLLQPFQFSSVTFSHWEQGKPPIQLIKRSEGLCFLTKVSGHFEGEGESVRLWIDKDGYWYLGGDSHQLGVNAECAVLKY